MSMAPCPVDVEFRRHVQHVNVVHVPRLAGWLATDCLFKNSGAATKSHVVSTTKSSNSMRSIKTAH